MLLLLFRSLFILLGFFITVAVALIVQNLSPFSIAKPFEGVETAVWLFISNSNHPWSSLFAVVVVRDHGSTC